MATAVPNLFWILLVLVGVLSVGPAAAPAAQPAATPAAAPAAAPTTPPATAPQAEPTAEQPTDPGIAIYRANYCGVCHELPAAGTVGTFGPSHAGMGTIAAQRILDPTYGGSATTAAEYIAESILQPSAYIAPGYATSAHPMPSFGHLPQADIAALVEMLLAQ